MLRKLPRIEAYTWKAFTREIIKIAEATETTARESAKSKGKSRKKQLLEKIESLEVVDVYKAVKKKQGDNPQVVTAPIILTDGVFSKPIQSIFESVAGYKFTELAGYPIILNARLVGFGASVIAQTAKLVDRFGIAYDGNIYKEKEKEASGAEYEDLTLDEEQGFQAFVMQNYFTNSKLVPGGGGLFNHITGDWCWCLLVPSMFYVIDSLEKFIRSMDFLILTNYEDYTGGVETGSVGYKERTAKVEDLTGNATEEEEETDDSTTEDDESEEEEVKPKSKKKIKVETKDIDDEEEESEDSDEEDSDEEEDDDEEVETKKASNKKSVKEKSDSKKNRLKEADESNDDFDSDWEDMEGEEVEEKSTKSSKKKSKKEPKKVQVEDDEPWDD